MLENSKKTVRARGSQITAAKLFSGHDGDIAHMKSQQMWLPARTKPAKIPACTGRDHQVPPLAEQLLAVDS